MCAKVFCNPKYSTIFFFNNLFGMCQSFMKQLLLLTLNSNSIIFHSDLCIPTYFLFFFLDEEFLQKFHSTYLSWSICQEEYLHAVQTNIILSQSDTNIFWSLNTKKIKFLDDGVFWRPLCSFLCYLNLFMFKLFIKAWKIFLLDLEHGNISVKS